MDPEASEEQLDDRLCVMLYRASHAMTAAYRRVLDPLELTYPQYTVLSALWLRGSATVRDLGQVLGSDYNTMSPLIKRLEAKALVRRARSRADEREVVVELTDEGRELSKDAAHVQDEIARATGLSAADRDELVERLRRLTDHLRVPATDA